jgi:hypothetical protein
MRTLSREEISVVSGSGVISDALFHNQLLDLSIVLKPVGWIKLRVNLLLIGININIGWAIGAKDVDVASVTNLGSQLDAA